MTDQHHCSNVVESVWLNVLREDKTTGRRKIGEVVACGFCSAVVGDVKSTTIKKIAPSEWAHMLRVHPKAPWYFDLVDGSLIPHGAPQQQKLVSTDPDEETPF